MSNFGYLLNHSEKYHSYEFIWGAVVRAIWHFWCNKKYKIPKIYVSRYLFCLSVGVECFKTNKDFILMAMDNKNTLCIVSE